MTDRIKLTQEEIRLMTEAVSSRPSEVQYAIRQINDRRAEREAEIRRVAAQVADGVVPRGVVPQELRRSPYDELRARTKYVNTVFAREDGLRIKSLEIALAAVKHFDDSNVLDTAADYYKFLLNGEAS